MKKKDIKKLTETQKLENLEKLKKDLFNFRFQKVNGQIKSPAKINETKKNIARLKTLIEVKNALKNISKQDPRAIILCTGSLYFCGEILNLN